MKLPEIDLEKFEEFRKENSRARLDFIKKYAEWVKKTSNKEWSSQQKEIVGE